MPVRILNSIRCVFIVRICVLCILNSVSEFMQVFLKNRLVAMFGVNERSLKTFKGNILRYVLCQYAFL